jgi:hypothetical protein
MSTASRQMKACMSLPICTGRFPTAQARSAHAFGMRPGHLDPCAAERDDHLIGGRRWYWVVRRKDIRHCAAAKNAVSAVNAIGGPSGDCCSWFKRLRQKPEVLAVKP